MSGGLGCLDCLDGCGTTRAEIEEHRSLDLWCWALNHIRESKLAGQLVYTYHSLPSGLPVTDSDFPHLFARMDRNVR